jgi:hypothetical protein
MEEGERSRFAVRGSRKSRFSRFAVRGSRKSRDSRFAVRKKAGVREERDSGFATEPGKSGGREKSQRSGLGVRRLENNVASLQVVAIAPSRRAEATFAKATVAKARRGNQVMLKELQRTRELKVLRKSGMANRGGCGT